MSKKFTRPASANMADDEPEVPFPNISVHIANNQYVNHEIIGNTNTKLTTRHINTNMSLSCTDSNPYSCDSGDAVGGVGSIGHNGRSSHRGDVVGVESGAGESGGGGGGILKRSALW